MSIEITPQPITAIELKEIAIAKELKFIAIRRCGICDSPIGYRVATAKKFSIHCQTVLIHTIILWDSIADVIAVARVRSN
jgi:hypothetical protein